MQITHCVVSSLSLPQLKLCFNESCSILARDNPPGELILSTLNPLNRLVKNPVHYIGTTPLLSPDYWHRWWHCPSSCSLSTGASWLIFSLWSPPSSSHCSQLSSCWTTRIHPLQARRNPSTPVTPASEGAHVPHLHPAAVHAVQVFLWVWVTDLLTRHSTLHDKIGNKKRWMINYFL